MAGRGRGKTGSFTQEQLQSLGCVGKDMPQVQTAPPPTYPALMTKPVTLETTAAQSYQILWKEDFLNHMRDSPYFLQTSERTKINPSILSYSQKNAGDVETNKIKAKAEFSWLLMPAELQMVKRKRKADLKPKTAKSHKTGNIEDRLTQLEERERSEKDKDGANKNNSDSEQEVEEDEVADDEMDDENDYGNSYFDNGEAYNEEDDNLDDGPVY